MNIRFRHYPGTSIITAALLATVLTAGGCSSKLQTTHIEVKDAHRHYYPILAGRKLKMEYEVSNTGQAPLVISEIQTTCGCITEQEGRKVVPAGQKIWLYFEYDSSKNLGYVAHEILLYGNFDSTSVYRLSFDINVVPDPDYTRDYEELHEKYLQTLYGKDREKANRLLRRNYYIDSATKDR